MYEIYVIIVIIYRYRYYHSYMNGIRTESVSSTMVILFDRFIYMIQENAMDLVYFKSIILLYASTCIRFMFASYRIISWTS